MTATLRDLRDRAYRAADFATLAKTQYVPESEANALVNESASELYDILVSKNEDYFLRTAELEAVEGTEYWRLPKDFYRLRSVLVGDERLRPYTEEERASLSGEPRYALHGEGLSVLPAATAVSLRYVPTLTPMELDHQTLPLAIAPGWDAYVVYDAAAKMRIKAKQDPSALQMRADRAQARVMRAASQRDAGGQGRVRDVYGWSPMAARRRMWGF